MYLYLWLQDWQLGAELFLKKKNALFRLRIHSRTPPCEKSNTVVFALRPVLTLTQHGAFKATFSHPHAGAASPQCLRRGLHFATVSKTKENSQSKALKHQSKRSSILIRCDRREPGPGACQCGLCMFSLCVCRCVCEGSLQVVRFPPAVTE